MTLFTRLLHNLDDTTALAAELAAHTEAGDVLLLQGDLGVGKTAFCRAFIQSLLEIKEDVPSPTFTLVQTFQGRDFPLWHFDLYRLKHPQEAVELGIEEAFDEGVSLIEWPALIAEMLPENCLCLTFSYGIDKGARKVELQGTGTWEEKLKAIV